MENETLLKTIDKVVCRLMNLGGADYDQDKKTAGSNVSKGLIARDFGIEEWDWPQGIGLYGLTKLQAYHNDDRYDDFLISWFRRNISIGLPSKNINTTAPFLALMDLVRRKGDREFEKMCLDRAEWLMNELPKTEDGGFQHVTIDSDNNQQLWADTVFMAVLFLAKIASITGNPRYAGECKKQFLLHIRFLADKKTGLWCHGWSFERKDNFKNSAKHEYTGVASVDLAYASMFDNAIAQDLRTIGLI